ncbi:hypothetical protein BDZ89DRAFT_1161195 [Hymenopellis radicata]|nr:hypothetical protein BDZ89DRAFT_1161195 [Hymenopellis radicata]
MSNIAITSTHSEDPVDFYDEVPYFEPELDNLDDLVQHCWTLEENRLMAQLYPISEAWSFTARIPAFSGIARPDARLFPYFARNGGDFRFDLDINLIQMEDHDPRNTCRAQVWVAKVTTLEGLGTRPDGAEPESVVVKIVQPSIIPPPDAGREDPWSLCPSARQLAFSENWIYRSLSECQGIQVPWYFGKCEVEMPNGEQAHVLIMEYIQGDTLYELWHRYREATANEKAEHLQRMRKILLSINDTFDAVEKAGLFHEDIPLTDIIIDDNDKAVVIGKVIGFANKALYEDIDALKAKVQAESTRFATSHGEDIVFRILSLYLRTSGEYASQFLEWASLYEDAIFKAWYSRQS